MPLWRDEVFGPVLAIRAVASFDEPSRPSTTPSTASPRALHHQPAYAQRFLDAADTGQVAINLPTSDGTCISPSAASRTPVRVQGQGLEGLRFYTADQDGRIRFEW